MLTQDHLSKQDASKVDPKSLTPLTPEIISRQATINVGTIGHVRRRRSKLPSWHIRRIRLALP